jgi:hypothetical protein
LDSRHHKEVYRYCVVRENSDATGVPAQTLVRWAEVSSSATPEMKAVEVNDAPPMGTVTLVAPSGLRIEGVSVRTTIAILRGIAP